MPDYDSQGLVAAYLFDGRGGARRVSWDVIRAPVPKDSFLWLHLHLWEDRQTPWLWQESGIDPLILEMLEADETRPRCELFNEGALLNLRGVNLQAYAMPEDLSSLRMWVEASRVVTLRKRQLSAIADLEDAIARGRAPRSPGEFVAEMAIRLVDRMDTVINDLSERADDLEELVWAPSGPALGGKIADLRRVAIKLRRHIAPQREALNHFAVEDADWMSGRDRTRLREAADRVTRFAEELDSIRDRVAVIHDQIIERRSEALNRTMLVLAAVTVLFAPLTLVSGLLGMNVGGIPGAEDPMGFWEVSAVIGIAALGILAVFRRLHWI